MNSYNPRPTSEFLFFVKLDVPYEGPEIFLRTRSLSSSPSYFNPMKIEQKIMVER